MIEEKKNKQTSLADSGISEEEKKWQAQKAEMLQRYRIMAAALVAVIVIALVVLGATRNTTEVKPAEQSQSPVMQSTVTPPKVPATEAPAKAPTEAPVKAPTAPPATEPKKTPSEEDLIPFGRVITYPKEESYLADYETMYVKAPKGYGILVFWNSYGTSKDARRKYEILEGAKVTVVARERDRSCVIFTTKDGTQDIGWVSTNFLVPKYS